MEITWKCFVKSSAAPAAKHATVSSPSAAAKNATPEHSPAPTVGSRAGRHNMFNLRNYFQKWKGEDAKGLGRGDMLKFKSDFYGFRAGSRAARNLLLKLKAKGKVPSIRNFTPIFSPKVENNVTQHAANISRWSGLGLDDAIDPNNNDQFFKFLTGLAISESGHDSLKSLKQKKMMEAIRSGKRSL